MQTEYAKRARQNYLAHHGIPGQQWGHRNGPPYPLDPEKDYTKEEKEFQKKVAGNGDVTIKAGTKMYRMTAEKPNAKDDVDKLYVNVSPKEFNKYKTMMGGSNIINKGKSFVNEFIANEDIKIPSVKKQTKIERKMIKDPEIRKEMVESLMKKGLTREQATNELKKVNMGAAYVGATLATIGPISAGVAATVFTGNAGPAWLGLIGSEYGAIGGAAVITAAREKRARQLALVRNSVGDKENKKLTEKMVKELQDKGYNAMRDTNDRKASVGAKSSIILLDPKKQAKIEMTRELSRDEYADAYAVQKWNKLSKYAKQNIDFESYVIDGEKAYDALKEQHIIEKQRQKEREKIKKQAAKL